MILSTFRIFGNTSNRPFFYWYSSSIMRNYNYQVRNEPGKVGNHSMNIRLTGKEKQVISLTLRPMTDKEIAARLKTTVRNVQTVRGDIAAKVGAANFDGACIMLAGIGGLD